MCVICNSNRFHSFIFELCIMIVHTLNMCTDNAEPEQSLVLFNVLQGSEIYFIFLCGFLLRVEL